MKNNLHTTPNEHLEARITAWILGEASPFEAAELEALCAADPELQLFANRTKALHSLLIDSQNSTSNHFWKLSPEKREKLDPIIGSNKSSSSPNSSIRRAAYRTAFGIAAVLTVTVFIKRFIIFSPPSVKESFTIVSYESAPGEELNVSLPAASEGETSRGEDVVIIGGHVRTPGAQEFKKGLTLGDAVASAGGATEFGSNKRVTLYREGKAETYDLTDERLAQLELKPNDTIDMPQKHWMGCGTSRDEILNPPSKPSAQSSSAPAPAKEEDTALIARSKDISMDRLAKVEEKKEEFKRSALARIIPPAELKASHDESAATNTPPPAVFPTTPSDPSKSLAASGKGKGNHGGIDYGSGGGEHSDMSNTALAVESLAVTNDAFASNDSQNKGGFVYDPGKKAALRSQGGLSAEGGEKWESESSSTIVPGIPSVTGTSNLDIAGLRSGDYAIARESIDAILNNPNRRADDGVTILPASEGEGQTEVEGASSNKSTLAQREVVRRQNNIKDGDDALISGREAYAKGDYTQAVDKYKAALATVQDIPALADRRESYAQHLSDASVAQAQQMRKVGKYDEARELLKQAETLSPSDARITQELSYLETPLRTSPALTYEHVEKVDQIRRDLYKAQGNYDLGKYDDAKKSYEDILRVDPYNEAARRGMEKVASTKSDYYRAAYGHTRAELLMEVDKAWELAVPADKEAAVDPFAAAPVDGTLVDTHSENFKPKKEGAKVPIELIREFIYPNEFESNESAKLADKGNDSVTSELDLYRGPSDPFAAKPAEFEGFIDYGAPIATEPKQIKITTKHVEIDQANNKELGFDWFASNLSGKITSVQTIDTPLLGNTSEYLYRGIDLGANLAEAETVPRLGDISLTGRLLKPAPPSLTDLSQEISSSEEPFSTFSLNISDASFQLAIAAIEKGERPDPASIKPEQFYNAVDYGDPAPSASEPVAATIDQTAHPVIPGRNLVRVAVRTASTGRSAAQPLRLTLLVDQSGSMVRADRRAAMDTALAQLATLLTENDRITVIGFSRTPHLLAQSLPGNEAAKLPELINQTANEGGTNLEQAINLATEQALSHQLAGAQNRIVLFTDGAANLGDADPDRLSKKIQDLRQQGLAFDIAGIGTNELNDRLLSDLARHGNGRYYLVGEKTGGNLAAQLAGAFRPAAENVKVQVKLNPQRVGQYKLIGFEKDRLKTEDFRNDAVDAAELAADEAGVAIYQVETLPQGSGEIGEVSIRFRDTATDEMVERTYTIPYDSNSPSFDKANPKTQLATLALLVAQKLQPGPLADAINFSNYSQTIAQLKQANANSSKTQQLLNLINAIK